MQVDASSGKNDIPPLLFFVYTIQMIIDLLEQFSIMSLQIFFEELRQIPSKHLQQS